MRKYMKYALVGMSAAALCLSAGCSKQEAAAPETTVAAETTAAEEAADYVAESSVTLGEYKGIKYEMKEAYVTDELLDTEIDALKEQLKTYEKADKAAEKGDQVVMNYVGSIDGVAFDGGTANGAKLVLGSGSYIDGFEDGLIGVKAGDKKTLNLTFPENYSSADLAGKDCVFDVEVQEVQALHEYKEIDDAFVNAFKERMGITEEIKADDFREYFRDMLTPYYKDELEKLRDTEILNKLVEGCEIVCSTDEFNRAYETCKNAYAAPYASYGLDYNTVISLSGISDEDVRKEAEQIAKQQVALDAIAKAENITLSDEELNDFVKSLGYNSKEMLLASNGIPEDDLKETALLRKTLDFVVENAEITIKKAEK